jgi:hypothetical protein
MILTFISPVAFGAVKFAVKYPSASVGPDCGVKLPPFTEKSVIFAFSTGFTPFDT